MDLVSSLTEFKPGDFILVKFFTNTKRNLTYKYVAKVLQLFNKNDLEIQCFESMDDENTEFIIIDIDISAN